MSAERLPTFTPDEQYHAYQVTVEDEHGLRFTVHIPHALGRINALELARERVWANERTDVVALAARRLDEGATHEECGYRFSDHDQTTLLNSTPFGCPSELWLRYRDGDR